MGGLPAEYPRRQPRQLHVVEMPEHRAVSFPDTLAEFSVETSSNDYKFDEGHN